MIFAALRSPRNRCASPRRGRKFVLQVDELERKNPPSAIEIPHLTSTYLYETPGYYYLEEGDSVTLSAYISGGFADYGTVNFYVDIGLSVTSKPQPGVGNSSVATYTWKASGLGYHSFLAFFSGATVVHPDDPRISDVYSPSSSLAMTLKVVGPRADTTTYIGQNVSSLTYGQSTTLYAVVAGYQGVTDQYEYARFLEGDTEIGEATFQHSPGQTYASLTTDVLSRSLGTHRITVVFGGDAVNRPSVSTATTITVAPNTVAYAGQNVSDVAPGSPVTLYSVVANQTGDGSGATGSVVFMDGSTILGTRALRQVPGQTNTSLDVSFTTPGTHVITMYYSGDATNSPSAATTTITVDPHLPVFA